MSEDRQADKHKSTQEVILSRSDIRNYVSTISSHLRHKHIIPWITMSTDRRADRQTNKSIQKVRLSRPDVGNNGSVSSHIVINEKMQNKRYSYDIYIPIIPVFNQR